MFLKGLNITDTAIDISKYHKLLLSLYLLLTLLVSNSYRFGNGCDTHFVV